MKCGKDPEGWCLWRCLAWLLCFEKFSSGSKSARPIHERNKSPIQKANYTDLHILEEISAMICSLGANLLGVLIPTPPSYKSVLPISFPSSFTPATLASFLFLQLPASSRLCVSVSSFWYVLPHCWLTLCSSLFKVI